MITHTVLLTWKPGISTEQIAAIQQNLLALPAVITEIETYSCGSNVGPGETNADFAVVATFASLADWRVYDTHPEHTRVKTELMLSWIATRSVIQFG